MSTDPRAIQRLVKKAERIRELDPETYRRLLQMLESLVDRVEDLPQLTESETEAVVMAAYYEAFGKPH